MFRSYANFLKHTESFWYGQILEMQEFKNNKYFFFYYYFEVTPEFAPGWFESMAQNLNLPWCFVYYGYHKFFEELEQRYKISENGVIIDLLFIL